MIKTVLQKILPKWFFLSYHRLLSWLAAWWYGSPSKKMIVIGVTGTNGKSTTTAMICHVLEEAGYIVGMTSTVLFRIAGKEWLNDSKMTMLGRFRLQKLLAQMVHAQCMYAVIETSSEGIVQSRHAGIDYDVVVWTNLTPEHIESHGGYDNYRAAKGELFAALMKHPKKILDGKIVQKVSVVNAGDKEAGFFGAFPAEKKYAFCRGQCDFFSEGELVVAEQTQLSAQGSDFFVAGTWFHLQLLGDFNIENALAAIAVARSQNVSLDDAAQALGAMRIVPGRLERIDEGQPFTVIVDYAPEPASFVKLYEVVAMIPHSRIIHVFGSCGGGRDVARRSVLGAIAGEKADILFVTNEDPYDDDPLTIIRDVAAGATRAGKVEGKNLFLIEERGQAIALAIDTALAGDIVLITGKGAEQAIVVRGGAKVPWDDRLVVRQALWTSKKSYK